MVRQGVREIRQAPPLNPLKDLWADRRPGKIARIAPNVLLTSSIDLWIHVNKDKRYKRSDWYYHTLRFEHRRDNVFTQTDNRKHDELRRKMMPGVSYPAFSMPPPLACSRCMLAKTQLSTPAARTASSRAP